MTAVATSAQPTKEQFSKLVDQTFRASGPNGDALELTLTAFNDLLESDTQETFTLTFRASSDVTAEQGTYSVSNDALGEQAIFLVPISRDADGLYLEAVYNRFKK
ncbi:MAG: DUF6916 family protein [Pyrinomonadaceae bacterium]